MAALAEGGLFNNSCPMTKYLLLSIRCLISLGRELRFPISTAKITGSKGSPRSVYAHDAVSLVAWDPS